MRRRNPTAFTLAALLVARARIADTRPRSGDARRTAGDTSTTTILSHETRCAAPVASSGHQHRRHGADVLEHPEQPHGARTPRSLPGNATAYRMFEYGNDATRQCTSVRFPATTACAKPKSACITPGDHSNPRIPVVFSQVGVSVFVRYFFRFGGGDVLLDSGVLVL